MARMSAPAELTPPNSPTKPAQIRLTRRSPEYWRVTIDNPPINVMGPEMVKQFQEVIGALEADEQVRVVVFDSAVDDYFLNHSIFTARLEDLTSMPLATRIAKFDKWAIAQTKRLVNTSLPPDVELGAGWDACIASLGRPAAQERVKALMARGFQKPADVEDRLGYYLGQIAR
jgi:hypothetical protein